MAVQQFYLLGEPVTSTREIEISSNLDLDGLKHLIASYFAIVEPNGAYDQDANFIFIQHNLLTIK